MENKKINWSEISEHDKKEILNVLEFKRQLKEKLLQENKNKVSEKTDNLIKSNMIL